MNYEQFPIHCLMLICSPDHGISPSHQGLSMENEKSHSVGIIMNGVTGRMGLNQHLRRSIAAIIREDGISIGNAERIVPRPLLVGRNAAKLEALAREFGGLPYTTQLDTALADPAYSIYFDAQTTAQRFEAVSKAIAARKHVYCEKPVAETLEKSLQLYRMAESAAIKHGVVQDKLWLPGLVKLQRLRDMGFFGRILAVRGEFGYWVFEGDTIPSQRPSWNYRREDGGGIILDMFCHWRYILDNLFAPVKAVSCRGATHIAGAVGTRMASLMPARPKIRLTPPSSSKAASWRRSTLPGACEFAAMTCLPFRWTAPKARRWRDYVTVGFSLMAQRRVPYGIRTSPARSIISTGWQKVPEQEVYENAFKRQWELFLRHVVKDEPFRWNLLEGAKGLQLAEKGLESWCKRAWVDVEPL